MCVHYSHVSRETMPAGCHLNLSFCVVLYNVLTTMNDLIIVLSAIAMLRLYKIISRAHNYGKLSNTDVTTLALWLCASVINTSLMRLLVVGTISYGCALWLCRWVVARARAEEEAEAKEEDATEPEEVCGYSVSPSRKNSVDIDVHEVDPDMPPLVPDSPEVTHATSITREDMMSLVQESERAVTDAFAETYKLLRIC
jgi:multisubunit Na+/H+ antiporter MnhG subunit